MAITNNNVMVGYIGSMPATWDLSATNAPSPLSTNNATYGALLSGYTVVGIDNVGHIAGEIWHVDLSLTNLPYLDEGCYWADTNPATAPITLGTSYDGSPYQIRVTGISRQGFIVGNSGAPNLALSFTATSENTLYSGYSPSPTGAAGTNQWCGYDFDFYYNLIPLINGTPYTNPAYANVYLNAINQSNIAVGVNWGTGNAVTMVPGTGVNLATNLGPGSAYYLNDLTTTNVVGGTNVVTATPQIVGYGATNYPTLWDQYDKNGFSTNIYVAKTLTTLLAHPDAYNSWGMNSVAGINNYGVIVGTVYKYPNVGPPDHVLHGVMLIPLQLTLLNGSTPDFDGTIPSSIPAPPENPTFYYNYDTNGSGGVTSLDVAPMGYGRGDSPYPSNAYTCLTIVAAKAPGTGLYYRWQRLKSRRSWYFQMTNSGAACNVTWRSSAGISSLANDMLDTNPYLFENSAPSSTKHEFYAFDASALGYGDNSSDKNTSFMTNGNFIHEEKQFYYKVQVSFDGTNWFDGATMNLAQTITIKYVGTGGTAVTDWQGVTNLTSGNTAIQGSLVPLTPTITTSKVQNIVGIGVSINFATNVNTQ